MSKPGVAFDWITILLYLLLVLFGWVNIYSASLGDNPSSIFDFNEVYGKQAVWIILSFLLIVVTLAIDSRFYQRFSSVIYIFALLSLAGLFVFGRTIAGQTAWYVIGGVSLQPAEFVKVATALAIAKYASGIQTNFKLIKHQLTAFVIIALPIFLIFLQPDPGSALVYFAFVFPLYREGLHIAYILLGFFAALLFVTTLVFGSVVNIVGIVIVAILIFLYNRRRRPSIIKYLFFTAMAIGFSLSVTYVFENVMKQHHRDRFNIVLGQEVDRKGIGYNTNQSEIAIGSGGWFGKGWTEGTQTKGQFVPEQHTDYIFSTVGEEWGFFGTSVVITLFILLMIRLLYLSERQRSVFNRVYGYSITGIIFFHFMVNIGMVIGIFPTVGIPLPFFSYGGSGLWGFTLLLFIFIKLDAERMSYW
ncbi:rod shape-determining protein RodA [Antarcticibacterium flavum]|uniref:Rod shape-determining protein RodA n=1 Tax=Antarcticibacterium flavum TaxID=2058175 RepID=A0A5B7X3U4_9FLAO|nr:MULTISPECIES: rod shape-determining protein RodA [Antarcticibacterium]MCM4161006.1 rod shape-determining protein RodA [Antarcticibacterium sp. W02-3]QCY69273.1 rod shape-determining protein RodA [Antarcticibacterium flavum]